jgi:hypothetical protein
MVYAWEKGGDALTERYALLYARARSTRGMAGRSLRR